MNGSPRAVVLNAALLVLAAGCQPDTQTRHATAAPIAQSAGEQAPVQSTTTPAVATTTTTTTTTVTPPPPAANDAGAGGAPVLAARPLSYDRAITPDDLAGRTLRELSLLRNTPYAHHGHTFRRPWLADYFARQSWYHGTHVVPDTELTAVEHGNADAVARYDVALTRPELERLRDALLARDAAGHLAEGDEVEAVLLSARLGARVALHTATSIPTDSSPLDDPTRLDALVPIAALRTMSLRDLRILRNMISARRGRTFRATTLAQYFSEMDWYQPDPSYNDSRLLRVDRQNIRLIQSVEAEMGGPTTEAQEEQVFEGA